MKLSIYREIFSEAQKVVKMLLLLSVVSVSVVACGESGPPAIDICNDQAGDGCGRIAERECGLSLNAPYSELKQCKPYMDCEETEFDDCMAEQRR